MLNWWDSCNSESILHNIVVVHTHVNNHHTFGSVESKWSNLYNLTILVNFEAILKLYCCEYQIFKYLSKYNDKATL